MNNSTFLQSDPNGNQRRWLILSSGDVVIHSGGEALWETLPCASSDVLQSHPLDCDQAIDVVDIDPATLVNLNNDYICLPLRQAIIESLLSNNLLHQAACLVNWGRAVRHCCQCGMRLGTSTQAGDRARICKNCGREHYPKISPCVIVLIHRGDEILLAQGVRHPGNFYSLIAGYVEPGETLEQTVEREVFEETGLKVCDIQYQDSQPWSFPYNLMMGFTARYHSGVLKIAEDELICADWFREDNMPQLPPPQTIARRLINNYWARCK